MAQKDISYASFWLDSSIFNKSAYSTDKERAKDDLLKFVSVKRAIANFVRIVTGENIRVRFNNKEASFANGSSKEVILSSTAIKEKNFDAAVGLALHEGSHIKLSNFNVFSSLTSKIPNSFIEEMEHKYCPEFTKSECSKIIINRLSLIMNWIEDRRIDYFIYNTSPGYKGYYKAMYRKYFESPIIDDGLKSGSFRERNWESYKFRLINITNTHRDLTALKNLQTIWNLLDLQNINRFKTTDDIFPIAFEIYKLIESDILTQKELDALKSIPTKKSKKESNLIGFAATGLPPGVSINKRTGDIYGECTVPGLYKVIITAVYTNNQHTSKRMILEIK